jgi:hypothetical protein
MQEGGEGFHRPPKPMHRERCQFLWHRRAERMLRVEGFALLQAADKVMAVIDRQVAHQLTLLFRQKVLQISQFLDMPQDGFFAFALLSQVRQIFGDRFLNSRIHETSLP